MDRKIPTWFVVGFSAFMFAFLPIYWWKYGPANFLYFCDISLLLTWLGVLVHGRMPAQGRYFISMAAVGITIPQLVWLADWLGQLAGYRTGTGLADFMFGNSEAWLRAISLYHGIIPIILVWLVKQVGYVRSSGLAWLVVVAAALFVSYHFLPGIVPDATAYSVCNVNFAYGFSCAKPQEFMHPHLWLAAVFAMMAAITLVTHTWFVWRKY